MGKKSLLKGSKVLTGADKNPAGKLSKSQIGNEPGIMKLTKGMTPAHIKGSMKKGDVKIKKTIGDFKNLSM